MTDTVISWVRQQCFVLGLIAVVILALIWPSPLVVEYSRLAELAADFAVALIFLLQGLSLATRKMLGGSRPMRLHVFVLGWNFIVFPAIAALLNAPLSLFLGQDLCAGFWMLAILPTTIASATALTIASNGAVPQAIFASLFSNLLGILIVPLLVVAYLSSAGGGEVSLMPVFSKLCLIVLAPLALGQFLRRVSRERAIAISERTRWVPQAAILYIVYLSFAQSASSGFLQDLPMDQLAGTLVASVALLLFVSWAVWKSSDWVRLSGEERISVFFAASQKSIATGIPLLTTTFAAATLPLDTGLVLIPLLIFHPLQLLLGGMLVPRFADR